jgi:hypothetical protein
VEFLRQNARRYEHRSNPGAIRHALA